MKNIMYTVVVLAASLAVGAGCSTLRPSVEPVLAPTVDLDRFMGDWYVLASIPLWPERDSYNGVESYRRDADGRIRTTYTFRKGGFDGPEKTYRPVATVHNRETGAEWRMQFLWPFKAAFLIHYVSDDYGTTIIGSSGNRNLWIMAREPQVPDAVYDSLVQRAADIGYDISTLRRVPQRW